ncbi:hypothetical protein MMG00_09850 [Ignatzschineria rhizosphaerae]|uniref:Uncharacterized protein n=1 Tax=Ignatzschineria rhizosphaerae TaxID=2923279 RepID=A0ABY3X694_9GAMM|nr:hypothetical protein [Ignatzschineria rhizosphaerae]UNM95523.1 hypothetical protein MMG00_09850 [Ignatzschineria rhizosphaerae]
MQRVFLFFTFISTIIALSFNLASAQLVREGLEKSEYSGEWPFVADEVVLNCLDGNVTIYNYDDDKEYPLMPIDAQTRKVLFIEDSIEPILVKGADTTEILNKGKALCKGDNASNLPDVSDERMTLLAENRIIAGLSDPLSFKPLSHEIKKDDDNIFVTVKYQAKDDGKPVNGIVTVVFDYWGSFVRFDRD